MILVDTTVLAYAVGTPHPLRDPCRRLLEAHGEGRVELTTTVEVLEAFLGIRAPGSTRDEAAELTRELATALRPIPTTRTDLERGLALYAAHPDLAPGQAILAAVALGHDAEALVSADPALDAVPGAPPGRPRQRRPRRSPRTRGGRGAAPT